MAKRNGVIGTIGTVVGVLVVFLGAAIWIASAKSEAIRACEQAEKLDLRMRQVEQALPRIDEKLANIEKLLKERKEKSP